jgi:hypothetical protein
MDELKTGIDNGAEYVLSCDYSFLDSHSREMVVSAMTAVIRAGLWEYVQTEKIDSFMVGKHESLAKISDAVVELYDGHSGASYGCTMRTVEYIAKRGYESYKRLCREAPES